MGFRIVEKAGDSNKKSTHPDLMICKLFQRRLGAVFANRAARRFLPLDELTLRVGLLFSALVSTEKITH
jgi:hypothetical protein